ncbi:hypothetical protein TraAM80_05839 [Trypanosoma rangeli]|uniref:Membrane-associated protein n=1 Tax=Trypanosoma rangeli TaxID=5698 RepID=A0A422ND09_TRYRA|nr:uncharacterized protein TraAM80_05839 [Trypanosoma rangeli]RNF03322.1 hypothetical protein TraAM80_05839 [Trypanosoma rangeli]|eukprot:RNF03322.1 hypothetical protein TraAM80_05839 [Trypanosoma rangeli]
MLLMRLVFFTALLLLHSSHTEGTFYVVRGGCTDDSEKWTTRIDSAIENEAVVAFLRTQGIPFAGIAGYVQGGSAYWNDGSAMKWMPSGFDPSSTADAGFLVVRGDASWGVEVYDVFPDTVFICTDGEVVLDTTTTTFKKASVTTTTEAATEASAPAPIEAPTEVPNNVSEVLDALATTMSAVGTFDIVPLTTNSVTVPVKTKSLLQHLDVLSLRHHYFFGVALIEKGGAVKPQGVSTLMRGSESTLEFIVPLALMDSGVKQYTMCVVAVSKMGTPTYRQTGAMLLIHSIGEVLRNLSGSVEINEEDIVDGGDVIRPLRVMGPGTMVQHAITVSSLTFSGLSLTMINHRSLRKTCTPSNLSINFVFSNGNLHLFLPKEYVERVKTAPRSLCASVEGNNIVIADLEKRRWSFTAANSYYAYGEPIKVLALGASSAAVASRMYSAFLSHSDLCSSVDDNAVSLQLETSVAPAKSSPSSLPREQQELTLYLSAASAGKHAGYLCVQHISTRRNIRIVSLTGLHVKVTGELPTSRSSGWVTLFNGSTGSIALNDFVLPSQSERDVQHFNAISRFIMQKSLHVQFLSLPVGARWTTKLQRCRDNTARIEIEAAAYGGSVHINAPLFFLDSAGILCAGGEYLRVDYRVYEPLQWLQRFGDSEDAVVSTVVPSLPSSAIRVKIANWDMSSHFAVRFAVDSSCRVGFTANVWQASDAVHAVSLSNIVSGSFALCVGIYTAAGETSMFVSSDRIVLLMPYEAGLKVWEKEQKVLSGTWTLCGASSVCGYVPPQPFLEVCGRHTVTRAWPIIVTEKFYSLGSFNVKLRGEAQIYSGALVEDRVFIKRNNFTCQNINLSEMGEGGNLYSTSAVVNQEHSIVTLNSSAPLAGVILGFATWDGGCDAESIRHKALISTVFPTTSPVSALDLVTLLGDHEEGYFVVCVLQAASWRTVSQTYIHTMPSGAYAKSVGADAIAVLGQNENEKFIYLWETGTEDWAIVGFFSPNVAISFALVWDDASCHVSPAYTSPMRYVSTTTALVYVEVPFIAAAPTPTSVLYSCYYVENAPVLPLRIEQRRERQVSVLNLSLSSINYLPHFAIRYNTTENTTIILSDPLSPPITQLGLFLVASPEEEDAATGCLPNARRHVLLLMVQVNKLGLRYVSIAPSVPALLGSAGREVYLRLCATASKSVSPRFVPVSAYLVINDIGSVIQADPFSLQLVFRALNNTHRPLSLQGCAEFVQQYVVSVTGRRSDQRGVLITANGNNRFLLFIEPTLEVTGENAIKQLRAVYKAMMSGKMLPLRVGSADGLWFVLDSVEGVHLFNQTHHYGFPRVVVTSVGGTDNTPNKDLVKQIITICCIIILPVVVGFVVFSLQRTIPRLNRLNLGKGWLRRANSNDNNRHGEATYKADSAVLGNQIGDSPSPRTPQSVEIGTQLTSFTMENSAANPLYGSDGDEAPTSLGCTPPVGNATFSMRECGAWEVDQN